MDDFKYIGKRLNIIVDRPLGSFHPVFNYRYPVNYGYVPGTITGDNEELDAYILGIDEPITNFEGICIAVIKRLDDNENKLIISPNNIFLTDEEIYESVKFQEKYFKTIIIR